MNNTKLISHLKGLIIKSKLNETIDELLAISGKVSDSDFNNGIIMQAGKLNSLNSDKADGVVGNAFLGIEFAKLKKSLLYYIQQLSGFPEIDYQPKNIIVKPEITNQETNKMTGKLKKQFDKAFLSAFNSYSVLNQMLSYIDIDLDSFSNSSRNLNEVIQNIRDYGEQNNSILKIIEAAIEEVPGNVDLNKLIIHFSENTSTNEINIKGNDKIVIDNVGANVNITINKEQKTTEMGNYVHNEGENNNIFQGTNTGGGDINIGTTINKTEKKDSEEEKKEDKKTKILFLAASPTDKARVQTTKEHRIIKSEMERGKNRTRYVFLPSQFAVTITELIRALNDKPNIVHFSGHGEKNGILITNDNNESQLISIPVVKRLFKQLKDITKLVILNSCYSSEQAKVISEYGMFVIGNNLPVADDASISFAKGFYNGLSEGKTIEGAFNDAMIVLMTENPDFAEVVEIWKDGKKLDL